MESKFTISEILRTSWKAVNSQIWVLAGLFIAWCIIGFTLGVFSTPTASSTYGSLVVNIVTFLIGSLFMLGYTKNIFQALDGDDPQFSAYGQQARKLLTYIVANILVSIIVTIGLCLFIIPGFYLALRLQFFICAIVEEDAGILESLKRSWEITRGHAVPLLLVALTMIGLMILGSIVFLVGLFVAIPLAYMMYAYTFRRLTSPTTSNIAE